MLATLATVTHFKLYTVKKVLQAFFYVLATLLRILYKKML